MVPDSKATKLIIRILLFLAWLLLGAGMFLGVEKPYEEEERLKLNFSAVRKNFMAKHNIGEADMESFLSKLHSAVELGYDIKKQNYTIRWNFMNAFFFAGNVVTTIGYGHIVPATLLGRMLCIFYALVGIPITALTLRSVGNKISEQISLLIKLFERKVYNRESDKLEIKTASVAFFILILIIVIPAAGFADLEGWTYEDSVYFCFITLTTIGFGDFVPGKLKEDNEGSDAVQVTIEFLNLIYMVVGLAVMTGVIVSISGVIEEKTKGFSVTDPLEHINLNFNNNRALKKLGLVGGDTGRPMDENRPPTSRRTPKEQYVPRVVKNRSITAEKQHVQGPTPTMHLSNESKDRLSPICDSPKRFHNKVTPHPEPATDMFGSATNPDVQESASAEEGSDGSVNSRRSSRKPSSTSGERLTEKRESKNELIVEVQLTPLPTPRSSPVFFQATEKATNSKDQETSNEQLGTVENATEPIRADAALENEDDVTDTRKSVTPTAHAAGQESTGVDRPIKEPDIVRDDKGTGSKKTKEVDRPIGKGHRKSEPIRDNEMNGLSSAPGRTVEKNSNKTNGLQASKASKKGTPQERKGRNSLKSR